MSRAPVVHDVKCWPPFFWDIKTGVKPFDVRRADRDYQVGDTLRLNEWVEARGAYTGDTVDRRVTYVLDGGQFGIAPGFCVLGIPE